MLYFYIFTRVRCKASADKTILFCLGERKEKKNNENMTQFLCLNYFDIVSNKRK